MALPASCTLTQVTLRNNTGTAKFMEGGYTVGANTTLVINFAPMSLALKDRLAKAFTFADAAGLVTIDSSVPPEV